MAAEDTILVTGGAGFIGSHLIERLLSEGRSVVCFDNFNDYYDPAVKRGNVEAALQSPDYRLVEGDILNDADLEKVFSEFRVGTIIHLAARAGVRPSLEDPVLYETVNGVGTCKLLEQARIHEVSHFVFGSSSSVYGTNSKVPFSEDDPINKPVSPYAATKRAAELMCYTFSHLYDLPVTCLRFFTVYGPRQRPDMAIHKFTKLISGGHEITVCGDGLSRRDYTYVDDIVDGVVRSLSGPDGFKLLNLGGSRTVELRRLIEVIETALDKKAILRRLPDQPGDVPVTYADINRARNELGYEPKTTIEDGVPRFVEWFQNQREPSEVEGAGLK